MALSDILSGVGSTISAPGDYLRGLLAGQGGTRMGGRDMLEAQGILGANQEGLDPGDIAGFLAEMILDPLNLIPFGALAGMAKAGKLGKAASNRAFSLADNAIPVVSEIADPAARQALVQQAARETAERALSTGGVGGTGMQIYANPDHAKWVARRAAEGKIPVKWEQLSDSLGYSNVPGLGGADSLIDEGFGLSDPMLSGVGATRKLSPERYIGMNEQYLGSPGISSPYPATTTYLRPNETFEELSDRFMQNTATHEFAHNIGSNRFGLSRDFEDFAESLLQRHPRGIYKFHKPSKRLLKRHKQSFGQLKNLSSALLEHHRNPTEMLAYGTELKRELGIPAGGVISQMPPRAGAGMSRSFPYDHLRAFLSKEGIRQLLNTIPVAGAVATPLGAAMYGQEG